MGGLTGCDGNGRGPPIIAGVVPAAGRAADGYDGRADPGGDGRFCVGAAGRAGAAGAGLGGCGTTMRRGCNGGALGGAWPGSSTRRRMLGGTNLPAAGLGLAATAGGSSGALGASGGAGCVGSSTGASGASATGAGGADSTTGGGGGGGASTTGSGSTAAAAASAGASTGAGAGGIGGLTVLIRRGGGSVGADGFGGSADFLALAAPAFLTGLTAASEKMSPFGSSMPRCRASRSTNCRATISSRVLDALFSSMP